MLCVQRYGNIQLPQGKNKKRRNTQWQKHRK
nr:MAG TPA: hypothetical protein [Caudoviricetes sp.]